MNYKELHIENGYFAKVSKVLHIRGLIVDFPKNIFMKKAEQKITYELDDNQLNIYKDGSKSESIECPDYALRFLVATDVTIQMHSRRMDKSLIRGFDAEGICISSEQDKSSISDLIQPSKNPKTRQLEFIFSNALTDFQENQGKGEIPESVIEGFKIVINRYVQGTKNHE